MPGLTRERCLELLTRARVARLATVGRDGAPHLVPIVFAVDGDRLVTAVDQKPKRSGDLQRLRNIAATPSVCVLADHYAEDWALLWWVRADGRAAIAEQASDLGPALRRLQAKYPQYEGGPPPGPVVVVEIDRVTGWSAS